MNIGEFFVTLGVNADTVKVKDFAKGLSNLSVDAATAIAGLAGVSFELTHIAQEALGAAVAFHMFQSQTGLSWKELQKWQIVAEQANVPVEEVAQSIGQLQKNMAEIRLGRGNIAPFQMLGIGVNQNAFGVLEQLRQRIKGLDSATATNIITQMGLSPDMIQVLRLSDAEFAKFSKNVVGLTDDQEKSFLRAKLALVQLGQAAKYSGFEIFYNLYEGFSMLVSKMQEFQGLLPALGVGLAGLAAFFFPITAAIAGLLLLLEDISVYARGGKSEIGDFMKIFSGLGASFQTPKLAGIGSALSSFGLGGGGLLSTASQMAGAVSKIINQTVTMNIHSTAPADEVGKAAAKHLDMAASQAEQQTNNQGY